MYEELKNTETEYDEQVKKRQESIQAKKLELKEAIKTEMGGSYVFYAKMVERFFENNYEKVIDWMKNNYSYSKEKIAFEKQVRIFYASSVEIGEFIKSEDWMLHGVPSNMRFNSVTEIYCEGKKIKIGEAYEHFVALLMYLGASFDLKIKRFLFLEEVTLEISFPMEVMNKLKEYFVK